MPDNEENTKLWVKLSLYAIGVVLGLSAKLATMHRQKGLTLAEAIGELVIAAAAAFLVYAYFYYVLKQPTMAIVWAVLVGRYADNIIMTLLKRIEKWINKLDIEK